MSVTKSAAIDSFIPRLSAIERRRYPKTSEYNRCCPYWLNPITWFCFGPRQGLLPAAARCLSILGALATRNKLDTFPYFTFYFMQKDCHVRPRKHRGYAGGCIDGFARLKSCNLRVTLEHEDGEWGKGERRSPLCRMRVELSSQGQSRRPQGEKLCLLSAGFEVWEEENALISNPLNTFFVS